VSAPAASAVGAFVGAVALGSVAVGAFAVGALVVGRLLIRHLRVDRGSFKSLDIQELTVRRLRAAEMTVTQTLQLPDGRPEGDHHVS
jgi:hypothetical protein